MDQFLTKAIQDAIYAPTFNYEFPPFDCESWRQVINMSSPDQKHSELLGNGFLKSGFIVALWALLPNREYSFYEAASRALTANTTFVDLMVKAGVDDNIQLKPLGNLFEALIGSWVKNKDPDALYSYIIHNFAPLMYACEASYKAYNRRETAPVLLDEKAPKKRQKLEHTSSTRASGTLKVPKFTQYDKNTRHNSASTSTPTAPSLPSKPTGTRPFIATQAIRQAHQKDCDTPALDSPVLPPFAGGMKASPLTRSMLVVRDNHNAPMGQQSMAGPSPPAHLILKENQPPPTLRGESASLGIYQAQVMTPLDVVLLKDKLCAAKDADQRTEI